MKRIRRTRCVVLLLTIFQLLITPAWSTLTNPERITVVTSHIPAQHLPLFEISESETDISDIVYDDKVHALLYEVNDVSQLESSKNEINQPPTPLISVARFALFRSLLI